MRNRDFEHLQQDLLIVGDVMHQAMDEVSFEIGGEDLQRHVRDIAESDYGLPTPESLIFLEEIQPGVSKEIMNRVGAMQTAAQQTELAELNSTRRKLKQIGHGMLRMLG